MKRTILFKNTGLVVLLIQGMDNQYAESTVAVLKIRNRTIQLDVTAAELMVDYLQIMGAYLTNSAGTRQQVMVIFGRVVAHLDQQLKFKGRTTAEYTDIKELIQYIGCLHDWATEKGSLLQWQQSLD